MKPKKLKKKIQELENRLREDSERLGRLRGKLQQAETAKALKAARKSAACATASAGKNSSEPTIGARTEQCQESQEEAESFAGAPCATRSSDESQVGCEESR